jgi:hypothetical protein
VKDAIEQEKQRLPGELAKMLDDETYDSLYHRRHSYLARGIYADQLQVWMNLFPKEQFLILQSEAFYDDPASTMKRVFAFLELPAWEPTGYSKYNSYPYPKMDAVMKHCLREYFAPHNQRLYEYLEVDFGWNR